MVVTVTTHTDSVTDRHVPVPHVAHTRRRFGKRLASQQSPGLGCGSRVGEWNTVTIQGPLRDTVVHPIATMGLVMRGEDGDLFQSDKDGRVG